MQWCVETNITAARTNMEWNRCEFSVSHWINQYRLWSFWASYSRSMVNRGNTRAHTLYTLFHPFCVRLYLCVHTHLCVSTYVIETIFIYLSLNIYYLNQSPHLLWAEFTREKINVETNRKKSWFFAQYAKHKITYFFLETDNNFWNSHKQNARSLSLSVHT